MKLKQDFVTNSSSTSFTFIFKGNRRQDLFKQMINHEDKFNLSYQMWNDTPIGCDAWDLIEVFIRFMKEDIHDAFYKPEIAPLDSLLEKLNRDLKQTQEYISQEEEGYMKKYYEKDELKIKQHILNLEKFKNSSKTFSSFELTFGNDGIVGGNIGTLMDVEGPGIRIDSDDFYIITESKH